MEISQPIDLITKPKADLIKLKIIIGYSAFIATLQNNETANEFKKLLPFTIKMIELNGNEKYHDLWVELPVHSFSPGINRTGDLMLYGSSTLVLFYKTFTTLFSYTKLGQIDNPDGLAQALGTGNMSLTFDLE